MQANIAHMDLCEQASKLILKKFKNVFLIKYCDERVIQKLVICFASHVLGGGGDPSAAWVGQQHSPKSYQEEHSPGFYRPKTEALGSFLSFSLSPTLIFIEMSVHCGLLFHSYSHYLNTGLIIY